MRYGLSGPYWLLDNERGTTTLTTTTISCKTAGRTVRCRRQEVVADIRFAGKDGGRYIHEMPYRVERAPNQNNVAI